jgi:hypothetical protein
MQRNPTVSPGESERTTALENAARLWPLGKLVLVGRLRGSEEFRFSSVLGRSRLNAAFNDALTTNALTPDAASLTVERFNEERDPIASTVAISDHMKPKSPRIDINDAIV